MPRQFTSPVVRRPPQGFRFLDARGSCSIVSISDDGRVVLKQAVRYDDGPHITEAHLHRVKETAAFLKREREIYEHLGPHPSILALLEARDDGLLFPFMKHGPLRDRLKSLPPVSTARRDSWIETAIRSLVFVHSRDVIVGDVSARNFLVTDDESIVLSDFSGSGLRDLESMVGADTRYSKVDVNDRYLPLTVDTEIFAIGSLIYEIATGQAPYADLSDEEVVAKYGKEEYPSTADVLYGDVVQGCWTGRYSSSQQILEHFLKQKEQGLKP